MKTAATLLFCARLLLSQGATTSITGTVTDPGGRMLEFVLKINF